MLVVLLLELMQVELQVPDPYLFVGLRVAYHERFSFAWRLAKCRVTLMCCYLLIDII